MTQNVKHKKIAASDRSSKSYEGFSTGLGLFDKKSPGFCNCDMDTIAGKNGKEAILPMMECHTK